MEVELFDQRKEVVDTVKLVLADIDDDVKSKLPVNLMYVFKDRIKPSDGLREVLNVLDELIHHENNTAETLDALEPILVCDGEYELIDVLYTLLSLGQSIDRSTYPLTYVCIKMLLRTVDAKIRMLDQG